MVKPREEFLELLRNAQKIADLVVRIYRQQGFQIKTLPSKVTPNVDDRWKYTDSGDIQVAFRVETKHWPKIDFHSLDDVPYHLVIVDEAYKIDRHNPNTLLAYIIMNASRTGYLIIPGTTRNKWIKDTLTDGREGRTSEFYRIPKELCFYKNVPEEFING